MGNASEWILSILSVIAISKVKLCEYTRKFFFIISLQNDVWYSALAIRSVNFFFESIFSFLIDELCFVGQEKGTFSERDIISKAKFFLTET